MWPSRGRKTKMKSSSGTIIFQYKLWALKCWTSLFSILIWSFLVKIGKQSLSKHSHSYRLSAFAAMICLACLAGRPGAGLVQASSDGPLMAPQYLSNYCVPVSDVASRQQLRSASRHQLLLIPRYHLRTFGRQAFAVAGPTFWNSLADELRTYSSDRFKPALKTFLLATYHQIQCIRGFCGDALYKLMIDIDMK